MKTVILIPARYASTRYPGKPLAELTLADGSRKSLIQMSYEAAKQVSGVDAVYVATDDARIKAAAEAFGADVIMTSESCANGTERCANALERAGLSADIIVNLQGDAPLTPPWFVEALIEEVKRDSTVGMATPVLRCDAETYAHFTEDRRNGRVGGTTAVFNHNNDALYFSKEVVPFVDPGKLPDPIPVFHHVGVYAYRPAALAAYGSWEAGPLETLEGLEQLRFLENGHPIRCVEVDGRGRVFWELNNPEDVARIESVLRKQA
ncbi:MULTISPECIES: 3-deoxy-manno-octulosonate cytidylyltransferase [Halocynthiibacter]|uniref:3-deoxy-manno-octulosonate cytidylyltransferase n=1 Tax=Halocynthiibacter halioticoli TaxID=2986804 RepID=A0AAE3LTS3_9RHOB|nr:MULTISPECIES: manno-octulosonate cytidylyltransferase [Halocynthiibacter]MCV6825656.1 3-deoxy-manno-octulosonate cytidylyltransferase [Halocynthiibacter halioticoli]MCW4058657.1 3-deoxy-manno-octulosonate cytidylyltransferase [Halocynthiibacter sp. SDUM655004]